MRVPGFYRYKLKIPRRIPAALLLLSCALGISVAQVQGQDDPPLVVLVEGRDISTSSVTNVGPSGASELQAIIRDLGARTVRITLNDEIPADADLAVLLGPLRRMRPAQIARLWGHVYRGGNLLIAVDPDSANVGTANVSHGISGSGLTVLLERAYGVLIENTLAASADFSADMVSDRDRMFIPALTDTLPHDILTPLIQYQLPVWTWGARTLDVEPFGINGVATPLLYLPDVFGETETDVFLPYRNNAGIVPAPVQFEADADVPWGNLNVAAAAQSIVNGSRVIILADTEMFQNGYGLRPNGNLPYHLGNYLFAQRALAWLLEIPPEQWPALPVGLTTILIDGNVGDWPRNIAIIPDDVTVSAAASADIQQVRTLFDDQFVYLAVETAQPPSPETDILLQFDIDNDGEMDRTIISRAGQVQMSGGEAATVEVPDALLGYGAGLELRIPLRLIPLHQSIDRVCLLLDGEETDCTDQPLTIPLVLTRAVTELPIAQGLLITVESAQRINLRPAPGTAQPPLTTIANGTTFRALARNEAGNWLFVQNARYEGWLAASTALLVNGDLMNLPVRETQ